MRLFSYFSSILEEKMKNLRKNTVFMGSVCRVLDVSQPGFPCVSRVLAHDGDAMCIEYYSNPELGESLTAQSYRNHRSALIVF